MQCSDTTLEGALSMKLNLIWQPIALSPFSLLQCILHIYVKKKDPINYSAPSQYYFDVQNIVLNKFTAIFYILMGYY